MPDLPDVQTSRLPAVQTARRLDSQTSRQPDVQTARQPDVQTASTYTRIHAYTYTRIHACLRTGMPAYTHTCARPRWTLRPPWTLPSTLDPRLHWTPDHAGPPTTLDTAEHPGPSAPRWTHCTTLDLRPPWTPDCTGPQTPTCVHVLRPATTPCDHCPAQPARPRISYPALRPPSCPILGSATLLPACRPAPPRSRSSGKGH